MRNEFSRPDEKLVPFDLCDCAPTEIITRCYSKAAGRRRSQAPTPTKGRLLPEEPAMLPLLQMCSPCPCSGTGTPLPIATKFQEQKEQKTHSSFVLFIYYFILPGLALSLSVCDLAAVEPLEC